MATIDQITGQLVAAGHPPLPDGHPVADGRPHRYGPRKKYWYSLHEIVKSGQVAGYAGAFGYWSGDDNGAKAFVWQGDSLSKEDMEATRARQQETERKEEQKHQQAAKLAARRAHQQWEASSDASDSPYLERKQISAEGVRADKEDGTLFVPMYRYDTGEAQLAGLQKITDTGAKRYNRGVEKKGASLRLGEIQANDRIALITEGYATARSIRMATGERISVVVCFDAGGILPVAVALRAAYPDLHVLICADDDWKIEQRMRDCLATEYGYSGALVIGGAAVPVTVKKSSCLMQAEFAQKNGGVKFLRLSVRNDSGAERVHFFANTGRMRAEEAAAEVGNASVVFPCFANREERKFTDFNDLHGEEGLHIVKAQIERAILSALALGDEPLPRSVEDVTDPLYSDAVALVRQGTHATVSGVQRGLRIGVNRAMRLVEDMEKAGVLTAPVANGVRAVIKAGGTASMSAGAADDEAADRDREAHTWQRDLRRTDRGALLPSLDNVFAILSNDASWRGVFGFEQFALRIVKLKPPPFEGGETGAWSDRDDARCVLWLGQRYSFSPRSDIVADAAFLVADRNRYHEVRDYLDGLRWDGTARLRTWLIRHALAPDTEYVRLVGYKFLLGAVGRVMKPGCKMDNLLILEGIQDAGKSGLFRTLFSERWFTDANIVIGDKDTFAVMAGKWFIELAELDALSKSDSSNAKRFFTTAVDTYRPPYARRAVDVPRQGVFGGTVNFDTYLKDESGNRRYWPVKVGASLDLPTLARERNQIWAEAYQVYLEWEAGNKAADGSLPAPWRVLPHEKPLFSIEQDARYEGDIYETMIARHLARHNKVTMEQILLDCLKLEISKWTPAEQRRIGKAMKSLGWVRKREATGTREWYYTPPDPVGMQAAHDDNAPL
ncbi:VapE domain-containing protein [Paraburkholderia hayleyella]|uniref:VapE domain-containing protein n=1 Tax=Paraburkholderia hayleyella TaxID=2152889 RepID=UPI0012928A28|nr:VapE domain-containing protein [Paraburkholderia hayleyella]